MDQLAGLRLITIEAKDGKYSFPDKHYGPALFVPADHKYKESLPNVLITSARKDGEYFVYQAYIKNIMPMANPFILHHMSLRDLNYTLNQNLFSAIIFVGGNDISPSYYKSDIKSAKDIDERRDNFEFALFNEARRRNIPVLGICRGMQFLNVFCGGSLKNIENHKAENKQILLHKVKIQKNSWLKEICGNSMKVNSVHHQAVNDLGMDLQVDAIADDGIIEAISHKNLPFFGVQWHPEEMSSGKKVFKFFFKK